MDELRILLSREQIARRVEELGRQITLDCAGEPVIFIGVLKGAAVFLSDLVCARCKWTQPSISLLSRNLRPDILPSAVEESCLDAPDLPKRQLDQQ